MSFLINIATFCVPAYWAYKTCKSAVFQVPRTWASHRFDAHQDCIDFARKEGIRGDIQIYEMSLDGSLACAFGNNSVPQSAIAIILDPACRENGLAANACLRHEYTHIRNNDMVMRPLMTTISSAVAAVLGVVTLNTLPAFLLTIGVGIGSHILYSRLTENHADDVAVAH